MNTMSSFLDSSTGRVRQATSQRGSTLIWVMVVVLVMIIALGVGLTAVSGQFNLSSVRHEEHQAYYTALSSTETVAAWITENAIPADKTNKAQVDEADVIKQLLAQIPVGDEGITINEAGIPEEAGTCTVNLRWTDDKATQLKITSVATFAGVTETVSLTLNKIESTKAVFNGELEASDFDTDDYDERAKWLNKLTSDGVIALYDADSDDNAAFNSSNKVMLDTYIKTKDSKFEARWTNVELTHSSNDYDNNVLGTQRYGSSAATDYRRFMVPINGRITIDPLEEDDHGTNATGFGVKDNTRFVGLAIHDTKDKSVLFRLASGEEAQGTNNNKLIATDLYLNKLRVQVTTGKFKDRSNPRYASLITLDFTDNESIADDPKTTTIDETDKNTYTESYDINGTTETYTWHPNRWEKMDLFVQSNGQVTSNLVFGPFGHKDGITLDYKGSGNFMDWWRGYDLKDSAGNIITYGLNREWPYVSKSSKYTGLPILPVDFGANAHFWFLDSPTYELNGTQVCYAWFMQGTNILKGSIYSTRAVVLGGALTRSANNTTSDGLNRWLNGFADEDPTSHATYVEATARYSQLIYETDIILMPPSGTKTAYSLIRRPNTWKDRDTYKLYAVPNDDKKYNPTVTIKGGTIYVGKRQHLTIQGSVSRAEDYDGGNNLWVSPDKIVVAEGGTLLIEKSDFTNVLTDIYVEGGTLIIDAGAKIKGNIYAYNGGTVNVQGNFTLDAPGTLEPGQEPGGILIYGEGTIGTTFGDGEDAPTITTTGKLVLPNALPSIAGNSGRVHLVGGTWNDLVTGTSTPLSAATFFLCDEHDSDGRCLHYTGVPSSVPDGNPPVGDGGSDDSESDGDESGDGVPGVSPGGNNTGVSSGGGWTVGTYGDS